MKPQSPLSNFEILQDALRRSFPVNVPRRLAKSFVYVPPSYEQDFIYYITDLVLRSLVILASLVLIIDVFANSQSRNVRNKLLVTLAIYTFDWVFVSPKKLLIDCFTTCACLFC
ncbi:hypothetical protein ACOME3_001301 [Neoechinorhynchus agilis]